jgi:hypothetical protein
MTPAQARVCAANCREVAKLIRERRVRTLADRTECEAEAKRWDRQAWLYDDYARRHDAGEEPHAVT